MLMTASVNGMNPMQPGMQSLGMYMLADDGKTPVVCKSVEDMIKRLKQQDAGLWKVKADKFSTKYGRVAVSTVFLGLNANMFRAGAEPLCWETMAFGGKHDRSQERYTTREAAEAGHKGMVDHIKMCEGQPGFFYRQWLKLMWWLFPCNV